MKSIWKYKLEPNIDILIPVEAKFLSVQNQFNEIFIWFLIDTEKPTILRHFNVYGTGHPITGDPGKFLGTVQIEKGVLVFHVFEEESKCQNVKPTA